MDKDFLRQFLRSYRKTPLKIQKKLDKQIILLLKDLRHPSLHAKKYSETENIWQARVDGSWRFYFMIKDDTFYLLDVTPHPK